MQSADYCFLLSLLRLADLWRFTYVPLWSCKINLQNMRDAVFLSNLSVCRVPGHFRPDNIHHKTRTCSITWSSYTCQLLNYLAPCHMLDTPMSVYTVRVFYFCLSSSRLPSNCSGCFVRSFCHGCLIRPFCENSFAISRPPRWVIEDFWTVVLKQL